MFTWKIPRQTNIQFLMSNRRKFANGEVHIIELSKYEAPKVQEVRGKEWVSYGEKNAYFDHLIHAYLHSTTNNAIITGVANMIYGKGLDATDSQRKPDEYAQMKSIFKPGELKKVALDRKMLGMAAMQVIYEKGLVKKVEHFPMNTLRAEKANDNGEIESWYYFPDWANIKPNEKPTRIPAFGFGNGKESEIYVVKPYVSGAFYYPPIDYQGALPYAKLEEEISEYLINDTMNGFSGTKVVNFNNGVPESPEKREQIVSKVKNKLTGARGDKVIVSFSNNKEQETSVTDIPLNDAPAHYEYLANECFEKLIVGHRVTSPMLLGIRSGNNGLGNNADEIKTATLLFDNITIKPYQEELLEAIDEILSVNDISLNIYFRTLQPLEFTEVDNVSPSAKEEETGVKMHEHKHDLDKEGAELLIDLGEELDLKDWELIDERDVDYDLEDALDLEVENLNKLSEQKPKSLFSKLFKFVSTGIARPNSKSEQDAEIGGYKYIVRYSYEGDTTDKSREFCKKMTAAAKLYRKEDIIEMGNKVVNKGWGANGADTYSIWLWKGGGSCHHKFVRKTFKSTVKIDVNNPNAPTISTNKAEKEGYRIRNPKEVAMMPKDMPYEGFLPTNKRFR